MQGKQSDQKAKCAQGRRTKSDKVPEYLTVEQLADLATNEKIRPIARQQPLRRSPRKHAAKKQQKAKKTPAKKAAPEAAEKPLPKKVTIFNIMPWAQFFETADVFYFKMLSSFFLVIREAQQRNISLLMNPHQKKKPRPARLLSQMPGQTLLLNLAVGKQS